MGFPWVFVSVAARVFVRIVEDVRSFSLSFFFSTLRRAIFYSSLISLEYELTRKNMKVLYVDYNEIVLIARNIIVSNE